VKVNSLIKINPDTLSVQKANGDGFIDVQSPGIIQARLISSFKRVGMFGEKEVKSGVLPKTKEILFHVHGGGYVAQSSKSHLVYLLEWAVNLNIPIISIDYSLAPEFPFPRAANEVFYAYCWALQNCHLLGSTCEKIVLCGDSAGANLCLSALIKSISMGIRKADGIFIAYCPILVSFDPSPSRLLCLQDPLIPFGFMIRCLKAYILQNETESSDISDKNNNKDVNLEIGRDALTCDIEKDEVSGSSDKSDSFEEISCFECHQTDSDIKAHISQISTASDDTLQSLPTVTEKYKDTLEFDSPVDSIDSIRSTISLERDPFDGEVRTSTIIPSTSDTQYIDNFIGKYTMEDIPLNLGTHARKLSRTKSEENIIIDVSKETICASNIHRRFQFAASSFRRCFSSTFGGFTRNNHTIINSFEHDSKSKASSGTVEDFSFKVPKDPLLSPFYASDEILQEFPPIRILSLTLDSCLDDSVMFAKRLKSLNVNFTLDVLDKLPHGFLNFSRVSKSTRMQPATC
jgi:hormone-sensitive lipase